MYQLFFVRFQNIFVSTSLKFNSRFLCTNSSTAGGIFCYSRNDIYFVTCALNIRSHPPPSLYVPGFHRC